MTITKLFQFVASHDCSQQRPFIDNDAIQLPVDCRLADGRWFTEWTPVRTLREARDALGY